LLAVDLAISMRNHGGGMATLLAFGFLAVSTFFVYRSFYGMRIQG
jgi:K(+)-stimulated pyrophosphate-energized sodium pump